MDEVHARTRGSGRGAYRGADRRGGVHAERAQTGRSWWGSGLLLVAASGVLSWGIAALPAESARAAVTHVAVAATGLTLGSVGLLVLLWRISAGAAAARTSLAVITLLPVPTLLAPDVGAGAAPAAGLLSLLAAGSVMAGLRGPDIDTGLDPPRTVAVRVAVIVTIVAGCQLFVARAWAEVVSLVTVGAAALAWLVIAIVSARRGRGEHHVLAAWTMWAWVGLAGVAVARLAAQLTSDGTAGADWALGAASVRSLALLLVLIGAAVALRHAFEGQSRKLYLAHLDRVAASTDPDAERRRVHEARNAIVAIEGATLLLERYRDRLPTDHQRELTEGVSREARRLQSLVEPDGAPIGSGRPSTHTEPPADRRSRRTTRR